jgi:hypothetical protein
MTSSRGHGSVMAKLVPSGVEQDEARRYVPRPSRHSLIAPGRQARAAIDCSP